MPSDTGKENGRLCPLSGIKILDLSTQVPGPFCSMLLADLGAEVIKIENIDATDQTRLLPYLFNGINRNKKSILLNLKSEEAKNIFYRMAKSADVILEGFRPGVCKKLKIDYDAIKEFNPQIIYCSITGYGQDGPYRDKPGHDINYLGYSGILGLEGDLNKYTGMQALPLADLTGSMFGAVSILAALMQRTKTGKGEYLDVSMTAGVFSLIGASISSGFQAQGESLYIPHYGLFKTQDEKYLTLGIVHEEHFWNNLCSVIDMGELAGLDLVSRIGKRAEIVARLNTIFMTRNRDEWIAILSKADVPCGPAYSIEESFYDPQIAQRGSVFEMKDCSGENLKFRAFPVAFSESMTRKDSAPPAPGMHTMEILRGLGYGEEEIAKLIKDRIAG